MTIEEHAAAVFLAGCRHPVGSWNKRFSRDLAAMPIEQELTNKQRVNLWRLVVRYRKQIPDSFIQVHIMAHESRWREIANRIITETVAKAREHDPSVGALRLRQLVSQKYPFGQREMHPYKIWLDAVKKLIPMPEKPPGIIVFPGRVQCDWCNSRGCLCCYAARDAIRPSQYDTEFDKAWLAGEMPGAAYADYCEERGFPDAAEYVRNLPVKKKRKAKAKT